MKNKEIEELKRSSIGHSLIKAARLFNDFAFINAKDHFGMENLRQSHLQLFAYIPFEGITVNELAMKAKISKQAVSSLVKELLESKVLIKRGNPQDKRSFIVSFNERSNKGIFQGMKYLKSLDQDIVSVLGAADSKKIHKSLLRLIDEFESEKNSNL